MGKLSGKVALVTGASKGIGAAIAESLGAAGAAVAVNYSTSREGADRVVEKITKAGGKAIAVQGSVANSADVQRIFAETKAALGPVDTLVNNAGVYKFASIEQFSDEDYDWIFNTNVRGLLRTTQEAVKQFGDRGGSIINIGSLVSHITPPNSAIYTATKGAVDAITGVLSRELGPKGIRVNSINPGLVVTEGVQTAGFHEGEFYEWAKSTTPLGRVGQPNDYGDVAVFLASDDAKWITGETLKVAGGNR